MSRSLTLIGHITLKRNMLEHFHVIPKPNVCQIEFTEDQKSRTLYVFRRGMQY